MIHCLVKTVKGHIGSCFYNSKQCLLSAFSPRIFLLAECAHFVLLLSTSQCLMLTDIKRGPMCHSEPWHGPGDRLLSPRHKHCFFHHVMWTAAPPPVFSAFLQNPLKQAFLFLFEEWNTVISNRKCSLDNLTNCNMIHSSSRLFIFMDGVYSLIGLYTNTITLFLKACVWILPGWSYIRRKHLKDHCKFSFQNQNFLMCCGHYSPVFVVFKQNHTSGII